MIISPTTEEGNFKGVQGMQIRGKKNRWGEKEKGEVG